MRASPSPATALNAVTPTGPSTPNVDLLSRHLNHRRYRLVRRCRPLYRSRKYRSEWLVIAPSTDCITSFRFGNPAANRRRVFLSLGPGPFLVRHSTVHIIGRSSKLGRAPTTCRIFTDYPFPTVWATNPASVQRSRSITSRPSTNVGVFIISFI